MYEPAVVCNRVIGNEVCVDKMKVFEEPTRPLASSGLILCLGDIVKSYTVCSCIGFSTERSREMPVLVSCQALLF